MRSICEGSVVAPISLSVPNTSFCQDLEVEPHSLSKKKVLYFLFHTPAPLAVLHIAYSLFGFGVKNKIKINCFASSMWLYITLCLISSSNTIKYVIHHRIIPHTLLTPHM